MSAPDRASDPAHDDALSEYQAARDKVDAAVAALATRAGNAITCHRGCASCCVDGLSVLPVEAAAMRASLRAAPAAARPAPRTGMCAFLDVDDTCAVYAVRPLLCRTHGLPLRLTTVPPRQGLKVVDDVSVCALNFTARDPLPAETLDGAAVQMLLTTVDARFVARTGVSTDRVALQTLARESQR